MTFVTSKIGKGPLRLDTSITNYPGTMSLVKECGKMQNQWPDIYLSKFL